MGFATPIYPAVDPETFLRQPLMDRIRILALKWVDYGYGVPWMIHLLYIVKLEFFYALGGIVVATVTSGLPAFWHVSGWWNQPNTPSRYWTAMAITFCVAASRPKS